MIRPEKPKTRAASKSYESTLPFDDNRVGAAAVYCSDGRFGEQMDEFLHQSLGLPRYDRVAVPGGAACMAGHMMVYHEATALDRQLSFLITSHSLNRVVLIAHENCGFYKGMWIGTTPLEQQQASDLKRPPTIFDRIIQGWKSKLILLEKWMGKYGLKNGMLRQISKHRRHSQSWRVFSRGCMPSRMQLQRHRACNRSCLACQI